MLTKVLLTCREIALLSSKEFDTQLPLGLRIRMRVHSVMCKACFRYRKQLRIIHSFINKIAPDYDTASSFMASDHLSDSSKERIKAFLKNQ